MQQIRLHGAEKIRGWVHIDEHTMWQYFMKPFQALVGVRFGADGYEAVILGAVVNEFVDIGVERQGDMHLLRCGDQGAAQLAVIGVTQLLITGNGVQYGDIVRSHQSPFLCFVTEFFTDLQNLAAGLFFDGERRIAVEQA